MNAFYFQVIAVLFIITLFLIFCDPPRR